MVDNMKDYNIIIEEKRRILNRPITGVIQEDRIWEQWYSAEAMNSSFPKMNQRDYLFECNKDYPNQVILNNRGQKKWTVRQFEAEVDKMSNIIKYGYGIGKGDIVCTISLSTPELVFLKYACATVGAITCHLNFFDADKVLDDENSLFSQICELKPKMVFYLDYLESKVCDVLNRKEIQNVVKVRLPLCHSTRLLSPERVALALLRSKNKKEKSVKGANSYKEFLKKYDGTKTKVESVYEPGLPCNIAFTSGTTGKNKAVLISHDADNALAFQQMLADRLNFDRGTKQLALVPPFLAFWDADIIHCTLCLGAETILELNLSYEKIPGYIKKYRPNMGIWSQWLWDSILHLPEKQLKEVSKNLNGVIVGGERAEINQQISFYEKTGVLQNVGFGATEVNTTFSYTIPNCKVLGSAGVPMPFCNVRILDSEGNNCTYNVPGRLYIATPAMMLGYYGRPDLTAEALSTDEKGIIWYNTKDYAYVDENGCLYVLDRDKEPVLINVNDGQEQVNLLDLVEKVKPERCIKICKLTSYEGRMMLHVVLDEFYDIKKEEAIKNIIRRIKDNLPEKHYPDVIRVLAALPRTSVGKVDYPKLNDETVEIFEKTKICGKLNLL